MPWGLDVSLVISFLSMISDRVSHCIWQWDDIHRAKALSESFGASTQCASLCYMQFAHNCSSLTIVGVIEQILTSLVVFQVVTAPMSSINAIAVEAYKKYILVSLIHHGQVRYALFFYLSSWHFYEFDWRRLLKKNTWKNNLQFGTLFVELISVYWNGHTDLINFKILAKGRTSKQAAFKINYTQLFLIFLEKV